MKNVNSIRSEPANLTESNQKQLEFENIKIAYDKNINRIYSNQLPIHIFGTGSDGNSIYIKPYRTLIDLGLSYKRYIQYDENFFNQVDIIILTHAHGDHINPNTFYKILTNYPHIKVYMHPFMWQHLTSSHYKPEYKRIKKIDLSKIVYDKHQYMQKGYDVDQNGEKILIRLPWKEKFEKIANRIYFIEAKGQYQLSTRDKKDIYFYPLTTKHGDLINIAIRLYDDTSKIRWFYASDLDNLSTNSVMFTDKFGQEQIITGLSAKDTYDCMLLEANYDENILKQYINELNETYIDQNDQVMDNKYYSLKYRADSNLRHISEQKAFRYVQEHLTDNGIFIPLHASKTFGTLWQN